MVAFNAGVNGEGVMEAIACVASVSVGIESKERPRNGIFGVLPARKMGREPKKKKDGVAPLFAL